ncbi:tRNA pseudouridine(13) synthase TruD [Persephonella sp.]
MELGKHIKKKPSDFVVEEVPSIDISSSGRYPVYLLKKSGLSTLQVVRFLSYRYRIKPSDIGFAGLKDKVAITTQYLTFPPDIPIPERECFKHHSGKWLKQDRLNYEQETGFCIEKVGYTEEKLQLGQIKGNLFRIKIHSLGKELRRRFYENLQQVELYGCPNYFGEQRFGSIKGTNDFIFLHILKGEFEKALKIYFSIKGDIKNWGNWEAFYRDFRGKVEQYERDLILGLKRGLSFEKAFRILPKNIRLMFNFAFQSYMWNEYLRRYIEARYPFVRVPFMGRWRLSFYTDVDDIGYLKNLEIPYTGREFPPEDKLLKKIIDDTIRELGIGEDAFGKEVGGIKLLTDGLRKAVFIPENLRVVSKTKNSITLSFFLPAGSYATVLIRRLLI